MYELFKTQNGKNIYHVKLSIRLSFGTEDYFWPEFTLNSWKVCPINLREIPKARRLDTPNCHILKRDTCYKAHHFG